MSRGRKAQIREKTEQGGKRTKEQKLEVAEMSNFRSARCKQVLAHAGVKAGHFQEPGSKKSFICEEDK